MTYKFKSRATGDLLLLQPDGRRLLGIIGKDAQPSGIILPGQMAAAVQALQEAIERDEAGRRAQPKEPKARGEAAPGPDEVSLRQRALPFIEMLRVCAREGTEVVWGV